MSSESTSVDPRRTTGSWPGERGPRPAGRAAASARAAALLASMRPRQWVKNGILFAGLVFSQHAFHPALIARAVAGFLIFCAVSSASYLINDYLDLERDRLHPEKRHRPMASGALPPAMGIAAACVLLVLGLIAARALGIPFMLTAAGYTLLILTYSLFLKRMIILDVLAIAVGFVLRAIAGVEAVRAADPSIALSPWLLVCTLFLALFLATGKRRQELVMLEEHAAGHRRTLAAYSPRLLDLMMGVMTAATLIAYSTYTIAPATVARFQSPALVYTIPFVVYGIFRYVYLVLERQSGGNPTEVLLTDVPLLVNILLWLLAVGLILYVN
jgi:4-hydroxybenzoate polyprenyltransferase